MPIQIAFNRKGFILTGICAALAVVSSLMGIAAWFYYPTYKITPGIEYGQRDGQALKLDVITPERPNGKGILLMVSGGWKSSPEPFSPWLAIPFLRGGYTIFAVHHISQPECTVPEIVKDIKQAARFIRFNAVKFGVEKNHLGITGGSSGGHLSLMLATTGDDGDLASANPILRESSKVQAVAIYFPPTDLINMGSSTSNLHDGGPPKNLAAAFGMTDRDPKKWEPIGKAMSPIHNLHPNLPPTLIYHGTADTLVPLDQSTRYREAATSAGNIVKVVTVKNGGHGWLGILWDTYALKNWFDRYLK